MIGHQFVALVCLAAFSFLLFRSVSHDISRTELCDTTYINPRYERVEDVKFDVNVPYSLIRYRESPSVWVPAEVVHRPGRVAVLFVHGHLGSHEQMRSMASETAKEISRRIKRSNVVDIVDWYGADFKEEPSGLEPRLLERQAAYVASCLSYLSSSYEKIVILGYSMGGIVVDRVLQDFENAHGQSGVPDQGVGSHVLESLAMVITIGSPHFHLPTLLMPKRRANTWKIKNEVPVLRVFSGPGDVLVPSISAWSVHARDGPLQGNIVEVDLENVPGVWGTASHKGLVSCNQLVRRIVPLILDGVRLESATAVKQLIAARMTSDVRIDAMEISNTILTAPAPIPIQHSCTSIDGAVHVVRTGDIGGVESSSAACFVKHLVANSTTSHQKELMVQIALHGLTPGREARLIAMNGDDEVGDLSYLLSPLPAMSVEEPTKNNRHWQEVIGGIQWMQNSTWFVEVSGQAIRHIGATSLMIFLSKDGLAMSGSRSVAGRGFTVVSVPRADRRYHLLGSIVKGTSVISIDVPSTLSGPVRIMERFIPVMGWKQLAQLVPIKLVVREEECDNDVVSLPHSPVLVSKRDPNRGQLDSDQIRTKRSAFDDALQAQPGNRRTNCIDAPLWHPSLLSDTMHVIVDPTCQYSVALRPDVLPAVAYATRYHAYALPGLLLALTILRLAPVHLDQCGKWRVRYPPYKVYGALTALVAVSGTISSHAITSWQAGYVPWLFLQTPLSIAAIFWVSICLDIVFKSLACTCVNIVGNVVPERMRWLGTKAILRRWMSFAVLVACLLHDFAPFLVAFFSMYALAVCRSDAYVGRYSVVEWGFLLASGVSPMVIAMSGGMVVPYRHRELYDMLSVERLLISFVSLGSMAALAAGRTTSRSKLASLPLAALAALSSLFGYCFGGPFVVLLMIGCHWL